MRELNLRVIAGIKGDTEFVHVQSDTAGSVMVSLKDGQITVSVADRWMLLAPADPAQPAITAVLAMPLRSERLPAC